MEKGHLIIFSGPSGVGKGTIKDKLLEDESLHLHYSVSCTTRQPRVGEMEGIHYYFVTHEKFNEMIAADAFLEYASFVDNSYGTPKDKVEAKLNEGQNVLLEIEMQGALQVIEKCPEALSIFLLPPSMEELEARIRHRGTEAEEVIQKRLKQAQKEIGMKDKYRFNVINDDVERAVAEITQIIKTFKTPSAFNRIRRIAF